MTTLIPRSSVLFPDVVRWLESWNPMPEHTLVRVEDYRDNGNYVLRAELPGMDPKKDIKVSVQGNVLSIVGERSETKREHSRSEFRYGSFARSVSLPDGADTKHMQARYDAGVLQVTVPVHDESQQSRQIPVTSAKAD